MDCPSGRDVLTRVMSDASFGERVADVLDSLGPEELTDDCRDEHGGDHAAASSGAAASCAGGAAGAGGC